MTKRSKITSEEKALFRELMTDVAPLPDKLQKESPLPKKPSVRPQKPTIRTTIPQLTYDYPSELEYLAKEDWISGEDCIHFVRGGLQRKLLQQFKKGQITIEASLDLHRLTTSEARAITGRFIRDCQARALRCVLIVHGKGHFSSESKPVLKNFLNQWLRHHRSVLAFHSAKPRDGGTGALYVLIKLL